MPTYQLTYARTLSGATLRAHRPTCKRLPGRETTEVAEAILRAQAATCCKPSAHALEADQAEARETLDQGTADRRQIARDLSALEAFAAAGKGTAELAGGDAQPLPVLPGKRGRKARKTGNPAADRAAAAPAVYAGPAAQLAASGSVLPIEGRNRYPETSEGTLRCLGLCAQERPAASFPFVTRKGAGEGRLLECSTCWAQRHADNRDRKARGEAPVPAPKSSTHPAL